MASAPRRSIFKAEKTACVTSVGHILLLTLCIVSIASAQTESDDQARNTISFVPHGLLFRPLVANTFEPRVGILSQVGKNLLRLDIGNSIDLLQYRFEKDSALLTMGSDFFTYTLLRGEKDFHFPVDASDYFFGVNFNYKLSLAIGTLSSRLRISHISAHFVDGHYDNLQREWKDSRDPIVYSREFFDGVFAWEPASPSNAMRVYVGATYLFHVDPASLSRFMSSAGIEFHHTMEKNFHVYLGYQATIMKVSETALRHNIQIGGKIGDWNGRGLNLYATYFSGYSIHGEYFDAKESYTGVGFLIDF